MRQLGFEFQANDIEQIVEHRREAVEKMLFILKIKIEEGRSKGKETPQSIVKPLPLARQISVKKETNEKRAGTTLKSQKIGKFANVENEVNTKVNKLKESVAAKESKVGGLEKILELKEKQLNAIKLKLRK